MNSSVPLKSEIFLLNITTEMQNKDKYLVIQIITAARIVYAQMWKIVAVPDDIKLIDKLFELAEMDIITERLKAGNVNKIESAWKPFFMID